MDQFLDESAITGMQGKGTVAPPAQSRFLDESAITGQPPKPPTFLDNLQGFLTDADSWKGMGKKAAQIGTGTVDLVIGVPGMVASAGANLVGRTVGVVQGKSRKEVEDMGKQYRSYIPEGFVAPLQTAAAALGLPPLDQSGMEMVMNKAGGFVDKATGGVVSDQDAKDAIELVMLKGGLVAGKSVTSAVKGRIDAKYGPKAPARGDLRGTVTEEAPAAPTERPPVTTAEETIAASKARIAAKRKDVKAAVKGETPEEKAARMGVVQLHEGPATWSSGGVDYPVRVDGAAEKGPDGRYYTPVNHNGNRTYVPTEELVRVEPAPQVGLPKPVAPPPLFPPDASTVKTHLTKGEIVGAAPDYLSSGIEKLKAGQGFLMGTEERLAVQATAKAGGKIVGPDGKPLGPSFNERGEIDPKLLAALGIGSVAVWAALRPEDMDKLAGVGIIGSTMLSGKARSVAALVKEGAPYHFETMLKLPQGATELSKQQIRDMATKFPSEAPIIERVLRTVDGNKISAAELHQGLVEETAGWKLEPKETEQYADYGLDNIGRTPQGHMSREPDVTQTTTLFRLPGHMQVSDANHFGDNRLFGWTRSFKEDGVTHVVEIQSDLAQHVKELAPEKRVAMEAEYQKLIDEGARLGPAVNKMSQMPWDVPFAAKNAIAKDYGYDSYHDLNRRAIDINLRMREITTAIEGGKQSDQLSPIIKNWPRRLIRETLLKATKSGEATVRFASADTVAKVEGWPVKTDPYKGYSFTVKGEFENPGHQTIYNRYAGEITRYLKGLGGKEVTDPQGHTWIEVPTDSAMQSYGPGIKMLGAADTKLLATVAAGSALGAYLIAHPDKRDGMLAMMGLGIAAKGGLRDADLIGRIKSGGKAGEAATAELYRKYAPQMERTLQGKFGRQEVDVQEAIQDGFFHSIKVIEKGHFRGDAEFSTYLHRAVVNRALNQLRAAKSRPETVSLTEDPETGKSLGDKLGHDDTPINQLQSRELGGQIDAALEKIDPRFREAFLAVERDGLSYEEAAAAQGIPINTLRSRIYRAKAALQEELATYKEGVGLSETPPDTSTPQAPRFAEWERGSVSRDVLTTMGLIAGSSLIGGAAYDDPLKGAIVGGILAAGNGILKTHPVQRAVMRGTTRLAEVLPPLRRNIRDMELTAAKEVNRASDLISAAVRPLKALPKEQQAQWESLYKSANTEGLTAFMKGNPELVAGYRALRSYLQAAGERLIAHGRFKEGIPDYLPLMVKDYKGLMDSLGMEVKEGLQGALMKARLKSLKEAGRELNEVEKSMVVNNYLLNEPSTSYLPSFAKHRRLKMTPEREQFYRDYETALIHHAHAVVADLTRTDFFGKDVRVRKAGKQLFTDVEASVGALVNRALEEGRLTPEGAIEARQVLSARFNGGEQAPAPWLQDVRNVTGITLLGQIGSGLIQTSEPLLSAAHHGFGPAIKAAATLVTGKGIKPSEFGLANHVIEEVIGSRATGRALSTLLKANLLAPLDQLGISQNLTASFIKLKAQANTAAGRAKIAAKWGADYGQDMPKLIEELQQSTMKARTPLVDSVLWQEISDVRPTSRIEMPELANAYPNARLAYHLRQFMLTQADLLYRTSILEMKNGNVAKGMGNLMKYAVAYAVVGIPADAIKDWLSGRKLRLDNIDYVENFTRNFGLSRYTMDQVTMSKKPGKATVQAAQKFITPPVFSVLEKVGEGLSDPKKLVPMIPLGGRIADARYFGGNERKEISQARVAKARGEVARLSPAAKEYLRQKKKEREAAKREKEGK